MKKASSDFEEIKRQFEDGDYLESYLNQCGVKYTRFDGGKYFQLDSCPVCGHGNCFTVWRGGFYRCYSASCTSPTGSVFDLIGELEGIKDIYGQLQRAAEIVGYTLQGGAETNSEEYNKAKRIALLMTESAEFYKSNLSDTSRKFLMKVRGRTSEMVDYIGYGQSGKSNKLFEHLEKAGFTKDEMLASGMVREAGTGLYDFFSDEMIIYPIRYKNRVSYFRGKQYLYRGAVISKDKRKITQLPNVYHLWGVRMLGEDEIFGDKVIFCEGEEDYWSLKQANPKLNVVAVLGQIGEADLKAIIKNIKSGSTLYTAFDPGVSGADYEDKFLDNIFGRGVNVFRLQWDGFERKMDIDDFLKNCDSEKIQNERLRADGQPVNSFYDKEKSEIVNFLLENAQDLLEHRMIQISRNGIEGISQMKTRLKPLVSWLAKVENANDLDMYLSVFKNLMGKQGDDYKRYIKSRIAELLGTKYKVKEDEEGEEYIEIELEVVKHKSWYAYRQIQGEKITARKRISNFQMNLLNEIEYDGEVSYEVNIKNDQGEMTDSVVFDSSERTDKKAFTLALSKLGRYAFYGTNDHLQMLWMYVTMNHGALEGTIRKRSYLGWLRDDELWLYANCAITTDGRIYLANENGDIKIGTDIYRSEEIDIYSHQKPKLYIEEETVEKDVKEIINHYWTMMDYRSGDLIQEGRVAYEHFNTFLAFGWLVGNAYMDEWIHEVGFFPFLEYYGQKGSGKTYAMQILLVCMGLDKEKARESWGGSRANMAESMKYLSCLPYYLDEYMNTNDKDQRQQERIGYLRNCYTRTPYTRGRRTGGKEIVPLRSTFCYSGQARPNDAALLDRTVIIWKRKYEKKANGSFKWLWSEHSHELSRVFLYILRNKNEKNWNKIKEHYDFIMRVLEEECSNVDIRQRSNYALLGASVFCLPIGEHLADFIVWLVEETKAGFARVEGENILYQFLSSLDTLFQERLTEVVEFQVEFGRQMVYIAFNEVFNEWKRNTLRLGVSEDIKESELKEYMKNDPNEYWVELGKNNLFAFRAQVGINRKRCIKLDVENLPDNLREAIKWGYMEGRS